MDVWTDGSNKLDQVFSYGCIFVQGTEVVHESSQAYEGTEYNRFRNVAGEVYGVLYAIQYAIQNGIKELDVYHDYTGLQKWADKEWGANNELSQLLVYATDVARRNLRLTFHKVKSHTGVHYNEQADKLAKRAIEEWI